MTLQAAPGNVTWGVADGTATLATPTCCATGGGAPALTTPTCWVGYEDDLTTVTGAGVRDCDNIGNGPLPDNDMFCMPVSIAAEEFEPLTAATSPALGGCTPAEI